MWKCGPLSNFLMTEGHRATGRTRTAVGKLHFMSSSAQCPTLRSEDPRDSCLPILSEDGISQKVYQLETCFFFFLVPNTCFSALWFIFSPSRFELGIRTWQKDLRLSGWSVLFLLRPAECPLVASVNTSASLRSPFAVGTGTARGTRAPRPDGADGCGPGGSGRLLSRSRIGNQEGSLKSRFFLL